MTTVYVTRYALSQGIFPMEAEITKEGYAQQLPRRAFGHFLSKGDYAMTKKEAIAQAEEKRIKKLKSLDKRIKRISALDFESMF